MLTYIESSIWQSPAQTLVNAVNCVGVMGKGIALQFKKQYPKMYNRYRELCACNKLDIGKLWFYRGMNRCVLNFPTKKHWRSPSRAEYIELGLKKFLLTYETFGISSISFPQLGTGNGGLSWNEVVHPLMEKYLRHVPIPVYIHLVPKASNFLPEYLLPINAAIPFEVLLDDLRSLAGSKLYTKSARTPYTFLHFTKDNLVFQNSRGNFKISLEELRFLWGDLNNKKMVNSKNAVGQLKKSYAYILPLLDKVPYIKTVNVAQDEHELRNCPTSALILATDKDSQSKINTYERSLL